MTTKRNYKAFVILLMVFAFAVCMMGVAMSVNDITSSDVAYAQETDYVYYLTRRTSKSKSDNGKEVMFVPETIAKAYGYPNGLPEFMAVEDLPQGSAILRLDADGRRYDSSVPMNTYVTVKRAAPGFDYCDTGTINNGWTSYSCSWGGVQQYAGKAYDYTMIPYYHATTITLKRNNANWSGQNVDLYKDGRFYCDLTETATGVYQNMFIGIGDYKVFVNGVSAEISINARTNDTVGSKIEDDGSGKYCRSAYNFTGTAYYWDFTVTSRLDGSASHIGNVELYTGSGYMSLTESNGVATKTLLLDNHGQNYYIYIGGKDTGKILTTDCTGATTVVKKTIDYYSLSVELDNKNAQGETEPYLNAPVSLRSSSGEELNYPSYKKTVGGKAVYTSVMQWDEADKPFEYKVYVGDIDTKNTITATSEGRSCNSSFYEVSITLNENSNGKSDANVVLQNGEYSYVLTSTNGTYTQKLFSDGTTYTMSVTGVIDDANGTYEFNIDNQTQTITYYTVNVKTYDWLDANNQVVNSDGTHYGVRSANYRTYHIINGGKLSSVPASYVPGLTFDKWSETPWKMGDDNTEYDFSTTIDEEKTLYAQFLGTEVKINGYIRTDKNGNKDGSGMYLRTPNVVIKGFDKGDSSIKSVLVSVVGFAQMKLLSMTGITATQGENRTLGTDNVIEDGIVNIVFNEKVSMATAQQYLKENIVYMPLKDTGLQISITASDGILSATGSQTISQNPTGITWKVITGGSYSNVGTTFGNSADNKYVYFSGTTTYDNSSYTGHHGIKISNNAVLYIAKGVTVTCKGSNGSGQTPGYAGIYVPSTATLNVMGSGTLYAYGGNAGDGARGNDANDKVYAGGNSQKVTIRSGAGGKGGNGGGGAGAGIGTSGGKGGDGGDGGISIEHSEAPGLQDGSYTKSCTGSVNNSGKNNQNSGSQGGAGSSANACGTINIASSVTKTVVGGSASTQSGSGGNTCSGGNKSGGSYQLQSLKVNGSLWYNLATCGAGGGGGGSGYGGQAIGTGGAGGAGGGGGGAGGICFGHYISIAKKYYISAFGGAGGAGSKNGNKGSDSAQVENNKTIYNNGGESGTVPGTKSTAKSVGTPSGLGTSYSVIFYDGKNQVGNTQKYYFSETAITIPEAPAKSGYVFNGWKLEKYGKNIVAGGTQPLTSAETKLYQPGESVKLNANTYGDITFQAVYIPMSGKTAGDKITIGNNVFVSDPKKAEATKQTYYDYTLILTLDDEPYDFGPVKIVSTASQDSFYVLSSSATAGRYELTLTSNQIYYVYVGGVSLKQVSTPQNAPKNASLRNAAQDPDLLELGSGVEKTVNFKSMKVNVTGINPEDVKLLGDNVPLLNGTQNQDGSYTFSTYTQEGFDDGEYQIQVNEYVVPMTTTTASFGNTATVEFSTVQVTLTTDTTVDSVVLQSEDGIIPLLYDSENGIWTASGVLDNETVYTLYINGMQTAVTTTLSEATKVLTAHYYEIEVVTRLNGTACDLGSVLFGTANAVKTATGTWVYYVASASSLTASINGENVAIVTPSANLTTTYVDYYTVTYQTASTAGSGNIVGNVPTDGNVYLKGSTAIVLDGVSFYAEDSTYYFAGWTDGQKNYVAGAEVLVNNAVTLSAIWQLDNFIVNYIDRGEIISSRSRLALETKLVAGEELIDEKDVQYEYKFKGWIFCIGDTVYEADQVTDYTVQALLDGSEIDFVGGIKTVYFTAVYDLEYRYGIHLEGDLTQNSGATDANSDSKIDTLVMENLGDKVVVQYTVTINDGINSIVLLPEFDDSVFSIDTITVNRDTVLGAETITYSDEKTPLDKSCKIILEGGTLYNSIGDIFVTITYKLDSAVGGEYTFGFVTEYVETTLDEEKDNSARSHAYFWDSDNQAKEQTEVQIFVDTDNVKVIVQLDGVITISDQEVTYSGIAVSATHDYALATTFDKTETYYVFKNGDYSAPETAPTADTFADETYFTKISDGILYHHNGYGVNSKSANNQSTYTIKWYATLDGTEEIDAPKNVGVYYIGVSATKNNYYNEAPETRAKITITQMAITVTIDPQETAWGEPLATLTGQVTSGSICNGDTVTFSYSLKTVTASSNAGTYTDDIEGTWDTPHNGNYTVSFIKGTYTITEADNSFTTALVTVDKEYNALPIAVGTSQSNADYFAVSKYGTVSYKFYTKEGETYTEIPNSGVPTDAGTYYVQASVPGSDNQYKDLTSEYIPIVISKAKLTIETLTASSKEYNAKKQVWEITDISGVSAEAKYELSSISEVTEENYIDAGSPKIQVNAQVKESYATNYEFATDTDYQIVTASITQYAVTVVPVYQLSNYTGSDQTPGDHFMFFVDGKKADVPEFLATKKLSLDTSITNDEDKILGFTLVDTSLDIHVTKAVVEDWISVGKYTTTVTWTSDNYIVTLGEANLGVSADNVTAGKVNYVYEITKATVEVPDLLSGVLSNYVYDKTEKTQTVADDALYTIDVTAQTNAGTYTVTATLKDTTNYTWTKVFVGSGTFDGEKTYYILESVTMVGEEFVPKFVEAYKLSAFASNQEYYTYENDVYVLVEGETSGEYTSDTVTLNWVISPAPVTVTIADKTSVYGDNLVTPTSDVTKGTVYTGDDLGVTLTKEEGTDVGSYAITGTFTDENYDVTFVDGTYTVTIKKLFEDENNPENEEQNTKNGIISAITGAVKEYTGSVITWAVADFTVGNVTGQVVADGAIFAITNPTAIAETDYTNANGKAETAWTYYTDGSGNIIIKYTVTATLSNDNYIFYNDGTNDVKTVTVDVEVFIKQATNTWATSPSVTAESYDDLSYNSVATFGDVSATKNFVAYYSEETCVTAVAYADLKGNETYYAKFYVEGTDNYTSLSQVVSFVLGLNTAVAPDMFYDGNTADKTKTITYDGLTHYFAKNSTEPITYYSASDDTNDAYTVTVSSDTNAFKDVGTYTVVFSLKNNWEWSDKSTDDITYSLTIEKASLTLLADDQTISYTDAVPTYTVTPTGLVNSETLATYSVTITDYVSCDYAVGSAVGTYPVTLADTDGKDLETALYNYTLTLTSGTLTVEKKELSVGDNDDTKDVYMKDLTVTYDAESHSISINTVSGVSATYTIDSATGNSAIDVKYDATPAVTYYTVVASLSLTEDTDGYGNKYSESYSLKESSATGKLTINPLAVTLTAEAKTSKYGSALETFTYTFSCTDVPSLTDFYTRDNITVTYTTKSGENEITLSTTTDAGEYTIIPAVTNGNYVVTPVNGTYTITKTDLNEWITGLVAVDRAYSGSALSKGTANTDDTTRADYFSEGKFGDSTTVYEFFTKDGETYTKLDSAPATVGTYYMLATIAETDNYNGLTTTDYVEIVISKKILSVDENDDTKDVTLKDVTTTYDAQEHTVAISSTYTGVSATYTIDGVEGNGATDVKRSENVATTYTVVATLSLTGNDTYGNAYTDNYELATDSLTATLQINPLAVKVTADSFNKTYGDTASTLSFTLTSTDVPTLTAFYARDGVTVTYDVQDTKSQTVTLSNATAVGTYTIIPTASNEDSLNNYTVSYDNGSYVIAKANIKDEYPDDDPEGDPDEIPDTYEDMPNPDNSTGIKMRVKGVNVYYNRDLQNDIAVKIGSLTLETSAYTVKYYSDAECTEEVTTPTNAGTYYIKVTLAGTDNYDSAEKTGSFEILKVKLPATTITYATNGQAVIQVITMDTGKTDDEEGVTAKAIKSGVTLSYKVGEVDCTSTMIFTPTATGTYKVTISADDDNYLPSETTMEEVFSVDFAEGTHDLQSTNGVTGDAYKTQYRFNGQTATKPTDPVVTGYTFKQWEKVTDTEYVFTTAITENITLTATWTIQTFTITWKNGETEIYHETYKYKDTPSYNTSTYGTPTKATDAQYSYTFVGWNILSETLETITLPVVTEDKIYYAVFSREGIEYTITWYLSEDGGEYKQHATEANVAYGSTITVKTLNAVTWFATDTWYTDTERTQPAPLTMTASDLSLYGAYVFDIGNGDVNGDRIVNVDDIMLYRQWIVGNYEMTEVTSGTEWDTVNGEDFDASKKYFLLRVADVNNYIEQSDKLDIRDASTIRMSLVGGFNWSVATGYNVTGQEVTKSQRVSSVADFKDALTEISVVTLTASLALDEKIDIAKDTTIYLNGNTISIDGSFDSDKIFNVTAGHLTIIGGTIDATAKTQTAGSGDANEIDPVVVRNGATVTLKDVSVTIDSITGACVYAFDGGTAIIESGTYTNLANEAYPFASGMKAMVLNQANVASQRIFVRGGTFIGYNPANGDDAQLVTSFLDEGYQSIEVSTGTYSVIKATEVDTLEKLTTALSDRNTVISLTCDITDTTAELSKAIIDDLTLDLGGHTLTVKSFDLTNNVLKANLTVKNGTIVTTDGVNISVGNGNLIIQGLTAYDQDGVIELNATTSSLHFKNTVAFYKGEVGSTVKATVTIPANTHVVVEEGATLAIEKIDVEEVKGYVISIDNMGENVLTVEGSANIEGDSAKVSVSGANSVVSYSVKTESEWNSAILAGGTITLLANITLTKVADITKDTVLNLNGFTLTANPTTAVNTGIIIVHRNAKLTVNGNGIIDATTNKVYSAIQVTAPGENDATNKAELVVNGGIISGYYYAINGHGSRHNTEITINGGTLTGGVVAQDGTAIYNPQDGVLTVNNGTLIGYDTAIEVRAGTLTINNGTFSALNTTYSITENKSGTTVKGVIIAISQHTTNKAITATINGGTFVDGVRALGIYDTVHSGYNPNINVTINGGTFNCISNADSVTVQVKNGNLTIAGGEFNSPADTNGDGCATVYVMGYGRVTISGGRFEASATYAGRYWTINKLNSATDAQISITGGSYKQFDPSNPNTDDSNTYVAEGYKVEQANGIYTVVQNTIE